MLFSSFCSPRRVGAMAIMLDGIVDDIFGALTERNLMQNSILVLASDNGAQSEGTQMGAGSNFPLRGAKGSLYEGAVRVPAFMYAPSLGHSIDVIGDPLACYCALDSTFLHSTFSSSFWLRCGVRNRP